jgi:MFS family permease
LARLVFCIITYVAGIWFYYLIQVLQEQRHLTPLHSVAWLSPVAISGFLAAITTGHLIDRIGPSRVMLIAMLAFLIGNIIFATAPSTQTYWAQTFVCTLVIPWGMDASFPAATLILSNKVKKEHQGMGASLVNTVVNYSISIGVGIAGTVEIHVADGNELKGYRGALYMAIGLSGCGVLTSLVFLTKGVVKAKKKRGSGSGEVTKA